MGCYDLQRERYLAVWVNCTFFCSRFLFFAPKVAYGKTE
jgi:hypothetical protein